MKADNAHNRQARDAPDYHIAQIVKSARALFVTGGVVEDALDAVIRAAQQEFGCRIVISSPAQLVIDGGKFEWPMSEQQRVLPDQGEDRARTRYRCRHSP